MGWYASVKHKTNGFTPWMTAVFIMPTSTDTPVVSKDTRILGRVRSSRSEAIDEAILYLRAERVASELETKT